MLCCDRKKEALAATWECERFSEYILGMNFTIETDHKPLLSTAELHKMPQRIQRFRLGLMKFNPNLVHFQGKNQRTADALSHAPARNPPNDVDVALVDEAACTSIHLGLHLSVLSVSASLSTIPLYLNTTKIKGVDRERTFSPITW